jgi:hypothetical protein
MQSRLQDTGTVLVCDPDIDEPPYLEVTAAAKAGVNTASPPQATSSACVSRDARELDQIAPKAGEAPLHRSMSKQSGGFCSGQCLCDLPFARADRSAQSSIHETR